MPVYFYLYFAIYIPSGFLALATSAARRCALRQSDHVNKIHQKLCHCGDSADRGFPFLIPDRNPRWVGGWEDCRTISHIGLAYGVTRYALPFHIEKTAHTRCDYLQRYKCVFITYGIRARAKTISGIHRTETVRLRLS
jgi:hypothetical protein